MLLEGEKQEHENGRAAAVQQKRMQNYRCEDFDSKRRLQTVFSYGRLRCW